MEHLGREVRKEGGLGGGTREGFERTGWMDSRERRVWGKSHGHVSKKKRLKALADDGPWPSASLSSAPQARPPSGLRLRGSGFVSGLGAVLDVHCLAIDIHSLELFLGRGRVFRGVKVRKGVATELTCLRGAGAPVHHLHHLESFEHAQDLHQPVMGCVHGQVEEAESVVGACRGPAAPCLANGHGDGGAKEVQLSHASRLLGGVL
mmetsp:Transcript_105591/g.182049  ORF Transcript_105591/g.182049 Transcript_105591/m.182049 type:complete len:206 (-) Transcript_105591:415-1032(-)